MVHYGACREEEEAKERERAAAGVEKRRKRGGKGQQQQQQQQDGEQLSEAERATVLARVDEAVRCARRQPVQELSANGLLGQPPRPWSRHAVCTAGAAVQAAVQAANTMLPAGKQGGPQGGRACAGVRPPDLSPLLPHCCRARLPGRSIRGALLMLQEVDPHAIQALLQLRSPRDAGGGLSMCDKGLPFHLYNSRAKGVWCVFSIHCHVGEGEGGSWIIAWCVVCCGGGLALGRAAK